MGVYPPQAGGDFEYNPYYENHYSQFKVPLPPRREGEPPSFVFIKQARRIMLMR
jgi:hypothetical protein